MAISVLVLVCAGTGWQWYAPSLGPWLEDTFSLSAAQTGLVFMAFGLAYTLATPVFGLLTDRGLGGLASMAGGSLAVLATFALLGPAPPLASLGTSLPLSVAAVALHGAGTAAVYIG